MSADSKMLGYLLRHKWFVFKAGWELGVPFWQLALHDWSKFLPDEWCPYRDFFYKRDGATDGCYLAGNDDAFDAAWLKHIHRQPHHWQHWFLREDEGVVKCVEMPYQYVLEMLADWHGAGAAQGSELSTYEWYQENAHIKLHPTTRLIVEALLRYTPLLRAKRS